MSVFITGATGYIGGEVLYQVLKHGYKATALVRNQEKADNLKAKAGEKVSTVIGLLDDSNLLKEQVRLHDIIINTADVDHVPSAKAIAQELGRKDKKTIFIHTSGTSILGDELDAKKGRSLKVYSDIDDIDEINTLDEKQPHRPVDAIVQEIQQNNPLVKTVIVSPSCIFGRSNGYDKIVSAQIPLMTEVAKRNGGPYTVYSGDYIWSHVHIEDLGELYLVLLEKLVKGENIPSGKDGYYFGSYTSTNPVSETPDEIEHTWRDVAAKVGEHLFKKKAITSSELESLEPKKVAELAGFDFAPYLWGTNSRSRADRAISIGWKPKYTDGKIFWDSIEGDVDHVLGN